MMHKLPFRLQSPTPEEGGSGAAAPVDRGDDLVPPTPQAAPPQADVKDDPVVKALDAELEAKDTAKNTAEDAAKKGDDDKAKEAHIPQARHKEILEKERARSTALAAEVAQLKKRDELGAAGADAAAEFATIEADVGKLEDEYATLLSDGEVKKAAAVMARIRTAERHMADIKSDLKVRAASLQMAESTRYATALTRIESAYPQLNPDHETYDEKAMMRVARLSRANMVDGMTQVAALQDAVETIVGAETTQQQRATSVTPRAKDPAEERKADAVGKTVKAVASTPPSTTRVGLDSDKLGGGELDPQAVIKMSQRDFATLSDATLAKMRGDVIA